MRRSAIAVLCLAAATATGCGSASAPYPPTGIDELVIPTPSPDPDDFVDGVTNPWFTLAPGRTWTYDDSVVVTVSGTGDSGSDLPVTEVRRTGPGPTTLDHFAQDRAGNVWWVGRDDEWFSEPGLILPAEPRLGDGYVMADAPGLDVRAEVVGVDETVTVPAGEYDDVVVLSVHDAEEPDVSRREYYAAGVGLVAVDSGDSTRGLLRLEEPPS